METLRDYLHHRIYNFRKVDCDPLRKIKRRIGYILLKEFCATSDEQLLGTRKSRPKGIEMNIQIVLTPLGHEPQDC